MLKAEVGILPRSINLSEVGSCNCEVKCDLLLCYDTLSHVLGKFTIGTGRKSINKIY